MDKLLIKEVLGSYWVQNQKRPTNDFFHFVCIFKLLKTMTIKALCQILCSHLDAICVTAFVQHFLNCYQSNALEISPLILFYFFQCDPK